LTLLENDKDLILLHIATHAVLINRDCKYLFENFTYGFFAPHGKLLASW